MKRKVASSPIDLHSQESRIRKPLPKRCYIGPVTAANVDQPFRLLPCLSGTEQHSIELELAGNLLGRRKPTAKLDPFTHSFARLVIEIQPKIQCASDGATQKFHLTCSIADANLSKGP